MNKKKTYLVRLTLSYLTILCLSCTFNSSYGQSNAENSNKELSTQQVIESRDAPVEYTEYPDPEVLKQREQYERERNVNPNFTGEADNDQTKTRKKDAHVVTEGNTSKKAEGKNTDSKKQTQKQKPK